MIYMDFVLVFHKQETLNRKLIIQIFKSPRTVSCKKQSYKEDAIADSGIEFKDSATQLTLEV